MLVPSAALLTTGNSVSLSLSTECDQQLKCHNLHVVGKCSSAVYASLKQYAYSSMNGYYCSMDDVV